MLAQGLAQGLELERKRPGIVVERGRRSRTGFVAALGPVLGMPGNSMEAGKERNISSIFHVSSCCIATPLFESHVVILMFPYEYFKQLYKYKNIDLSCRLIL